jgi:hypothetical protein
LSSPMTIRRPGATIGFSFNLALVKKVRPALGGGGGPAASTAINRDDRPAT